MTKLIFIVVAFIVMTSCAFFRSSPEVEADATAAANVPPTPVVEELYQTEVFDPNIIHKPFTCCIPGHSPSDSSIFGQ